MKATIAMLAMLCAGGSAIGLDSKSFDAAAAFGARPSVAHMRFSPELSKSNAFLRQNFGM